MIKEEALRYIDDYMKQARNSTVIEVSIYYVLTAIAYGVRYLVDKTDDSLYNRYKHEKLGEDNK